VSVLVLAGIVFLPVAAVFWISYETNVESTVITVFSFCYEIKSFSQSAMFS